MGLFGAGEGGVAGGVGIALFLSEEVGFPFGAEVAGEEGSVGVDFVAARQRGAAEGVVEVGVEVAGVQSQANGRAAVGVGKAGGRLRFFEAAAGDGEVGAVRQRFCDELIEDGVVPRLPPLADVGVAAGAAVLFIGGGELDVAALFDVGALAGGEECGQGDEGEGLWFHWGFLGLGFGVCGMEKGFFALTPTPLSLRELFQSQRDKHCSRSERGAFYAGTHPRGEGAVWWEG